MIYKVIIERARKQYFSPGSEPTGVSCRQDKKETPSKDSSLCMIKAILEIRHKQAVFTLRKNRRPSFARFINFYHTVQPHAGIR